MKRELDRALQGVPEVSKVVYLQSALHNYQAKMKEIIREQIESIQKDVDVTFLGYGFCRSLKGIEEEFDIPIIFPQMDDWISIFFTPERRCEEIEKAAGTWFRTPGWAEAGEDMVFKELHIERLKGLGIDPLEIAKELFAAYRRGFYIDTGVGDDEHFISRAQRFCGFFDLAREETVSSSTVLEETLRRCRSVMRGELTAHPLSKPSDFAEKTLQE